MKDSNVFGNFTSIHVNISEFDFGKYSLAYANLPSSLSDFFENFIFLKDKNGDFYLYGENSSINKFIVKFTNYGMSTVKLKDFINIDVVDQIFGVFSHLPSGRIKLYFNSNGIYLIDKLDSLLDSNSKIINNCVKIKNSIINCDNVDSIPSNPVSMIIANEIEIFTGYTVKILTSKNFTVTVTPSTEHIINDGSYVVYSPIPFCGKFDYNVFR